MAFEFEGEPFYDEVGGSSIIERFLHVFSKGFVQLETTVA
jgi:hypothetical protein